MYKLSAGSLLCNFLALTVSSFTLRRNVWLQCILGLGFQATLIPVALLLPDTQADTETHTIPSVEPTTIAATTENVTFHADTEITETTSLLSSHTPLLENDTTSATPSPIQTGNNKPAITSTILSALAANHTHTITLFRNILISPPFTRTTLLSYFFLTLGLNVSIIFTQWSSITYNWVFADVASVSSFQMVVSGLVLVSLPFITSALMRQQRFRFEASSHVDIFVVKTSVVLNALGLVLIALAPTRAAYVGAIAVYTLGSGVFDALRSFVTANAGIVVGGEGGGLGELYLAIGMVETIGNTIASMGWGGALAVVLGRGYWVERSLFVAAAGVLMVVLWCVGRLGGMGEKGVEEDESVSGSEGDEDTVDGCC